MSEELNETKGWMPIAICDMAMLAMRKESDLAMEDMRTEVLVYKDRIKLLEDAGNKLALLMLNGTTAEIRAALWSWRELNPTKKNDSNG